MDMVLDVIYEWPFMSFILLYTFACYILTHFFQRTKIDLVYQSGSRIAKIVEASTLRDGHEYIPYVFAWLVHF